jgi:hypothetical protein
VGSAQSDGQQQEVPLNWSKWIRQVHRWLAMTFTLIVALIFIVLTVGEPPMWLYYTPLPFLFLLMLTGLYMFFLPYVVRRRSRFTNQGE